MPARAKMYHLFIWGAQLFEDFFSVVPGEQPIPLRCHHIYGALYAAIRYARQAGID